MNLSNAAFRKKFSINYQAEKLLEIKSKSHHFQVAATCYISGKKKMLTDSPASPNLRRIVLSYIGMFSFITILVLIYLFLSFGVFNKNYYPKHITTDQQGNVYVTEGALPGVRKFSPQGETLLTIGSAGTGDGQFNRIAGPDQTSIDSKGNIYVLTAREHQIQKFDATGNFVQKWAIPQNVEFILVSGDTDLYMISWEKPFLQKADTNGKIVENWALQLPNNAAAPEAVTVAPSGEVYVRLRNSINKLNKDGTLVNIAMLENPNTEYWRSFRVDIQNNFLLASESKIQKFNTQGKLINSWDVAEKVNSLGLTGMAVDRLGNVYTLRTKDRQVIIQKFDSNGQAIAQWGYGWPSWVWLFVIITCMVFILIARIATQRWAVRQARRL